MTFTSTIIRQTISETRRRIEGTFLNTDNDTGGDIDTTLTIVELVLLQVTGSSVVSAPVVNESLPLQGRNVTIVTSADAAGIWVAEGY